MKAQWPLSHIHRGQNGNIGKNHFLRDQQFVERFKCLLRHLSLFPIGMTKKGLTRHDVISGTLSAEESFVPTKRL